MEDKEIGNTCVMQGHMEDKEIGNTCVMQGRLDGIKYFLLLMKEPAFTK